MVLDEELSPPNVGASCLACRRPLSLAPDCYPLVFRCGSGHLFTLRDLLDHDFPKEEFGPLGRTRLTLRNWEARARMLHDLSGRALRDGNALAAADFKEAAGRIERWSNSLRTLIEKVAARASPSD